ncbi:hypothetical protein BT96DRAFT_332770 [Gymnopus androsaceus JB14]|uniref:Uncharacterized protein n=1 Tax=Gymnopus androsaceus JB14 TaxID=1447944 RepID=A0A6A4GZG3_9AGAR|nr:hypothetical protein BT96DRAFT_332770 [Gymnopus androsaceus JB14]
MLTDHAQQYSSNDETYGPSDISLSIEKFLRVTQKYRDEAEEALAKGDQEDAILALALNASILQEKVYKHRDSMDIMVIQDSREGEEMLSFLYDIATYAGRTGNDPPSDSHASEARNAEEDEMARFRKWRMQKYAKLRFPWQETGQEDQWQQGVMPEQTDASLLSPSSPPPSSPSSSLYLTPSSNSSTSTLYSPALERPSRFEDVSITDSMFDDRMNIYSAHLTLEMHPSFHQR